MVSKTGTKLVDMATGSATPKEFVSKFTVMMGSKISKMLSKERDSIANQIAGQKEQTKLPTANPSKMEKPAKIKGM